MKNKLASLLWFGVLCYHSLTLLSWLMKNPPPNAGDTRNTGSIPELRRSSGVGNGNPLQYSCLENPMDRAGWATVHEAAKSRTGLSTYTHKLTDTNTSQFAFLALFPITFQHLFHAMLAKLGDWLFLIHKLFQFYAPFVIFCLPIIRLKDWLQPLMSISRATFCIKLFLITWWASFQSYINYYCNLFCCCLYFSYHLPSKHHKFLEIKDDLIHNVFTEALPTVGIHTSIRWIKWALSTTELLFNIFMMFLKVHFTKHLTYSLRKQD